MINKAELWIGKFRESTKNIQPVKGHTVVEQHVDSVRFADEMLEMTRNSLKELFGKMKDAHLPVELYARRQGEDMSALGVDVTIYSDFDELLEKADDTPDTMRVYSILQNLGGFSALTTKATMEKAQQLMAKTENPLLFCEDGEDTGPS